MFIKSFRVKSQTQVKGSERKKLRAELSSNFPSLTSDDLADLIPAKSDLVLARIYCNKGESVLVYQVEKEPLFFLVDKEKRIYPTVYALWRYPELLPSFMTHPPVIQNLANGADLMLPGVIIKGSPCPNMYGKFEKGTPMTVNTTANKAPQAVGITANDSMDMFMAAGHGKGLNILHVYGDFLWQFGSKSPPPVIPYSTGERLQHSEQEPDLEENATALPNDDANEADDSSSSTNLIEKLSLEEPQAQIKQQISEETEAIAPEEPILNEKEAMDQLLVHCLIKALKTTLRKVDLPLLTSNVYAQHVIPACPDNRTIDVKKSSYKKISKFLGAMTTKGLITVKEFPKGVENLTHINYEHEEIKHFVVNKLETTPKPVSSNSSGFIPPLIEELYQVSGSTIEFFRENGLSRGDVLSSSEIRKVVTDYINAENLKTPNSNLVTLNPILHQAVVGPKEGFKETLRWDEIFSRLLGKMSQATRITRHGQVPIIRKGKLEPIQLEVAKRTGNKKVTLIYNAYIYGIDENEFAHQIQVGVAASTSVGPAENKPQGTTQVLVQGSQVSFVARLLLETYKVPRKYIKGLELAAKEKKKGR